jgi:hypothetical protein
LIVRETVAIETLARRAMERMSIFSGLPGISAWAEP